MIRSEVRAVMQKNLVFAFLRVNGRGPWLTVACQEYDRGESETTVSDLTTDFLRAPFISNRRPNDETRRIT